MGSRGKRLPILPNGTKVGKLTVVSFAPANGNGYTNRYLCFCDCGKYKYIYAPNVYHKRTKSCGCIGSNTKHGLSHLPEYKIWVGIISRCYNPNDKGWVNYGGRGIKVCTEWLPPNGIIQFFKDVGPRPSPNLSLDRIDNDKDYEKTNVRWADAKTQCLNRRHVGNIAVFSNDELLNECKRRGLI